MMQDENSKSLVFGILSLVCAILCFFLGPLGLITLILTFVFAWLAKQNKAKLTEMTGYYLATAGQVIGIIVIIFTIVAVVFLGGLLATLAAG